MNPYENDNYSKKKTGPTVVIESVSVLLNYYTNFKTLQTNLIYYVHSWMGE